MSVPDGTGQYPKPMAELMAREAERLTAGGGDNWALRVTTGYWALMAETDPERLLETVKRLSGVLTSWVTDLRSRIDLEGPAADPDQDLIRTGVEQGNVAHLIHRRDLVQPPGCVGHLGHAICGVFSHDQVFLDTAFGWKAPVLHSLELCRVCVNQREG